MTDASDLHRAVDRLTLTIDQLRSELVRKDVYESDQRGVAARLVGIEKDVVDLEKKIDTAEERRGSDRRLALTSLAFPIIVFVIQLYVTAQIGAGR